jgi:hypothetical protein
MWDVMFNGCAGKLRATRMKPYFWAMSSVAGEDETPRVDEDASVG